MRPKRTRQNLKVTLTSKSVKLAIIYWLQTEEGWEVDPDSIQLPELSLQIKATQPLPTRRPLAGEYSSGSLVDWLDIE